MVHDPARATPWSDTTSTESAADKRTLYRDLQQELAALIDGESDPLANVANAAAAIYHTLPALNWVGFYLLRGDILVLGPFQGRPACVRIPLGRGVCGTAAASGQTVVVADVAAFPGHISCDSRSRSELVVPVRWNGGVVGVLDLDSPVTSRFDAADRAGCEALAALIAGSIANLRDGS
ncbi:MAG: GAF domain-containing protein [Rhodospirillales bacterium]|nr:GAF domain-containing protein [Rhodospirillales bacterium]